MTIPPDQLRQFFCDTSTFGELCDIIVPEASPDTWRRFLLFIRDRGGYNFSINGTAQEIPADPETVLNFSNAVGDAARPILSLDIDIAGVQTIVHFSAPEWIELDLERAATTPDTDEQIVDFIRHLGAALERDVLLTPEMRWTGATFAYDHVSNTFRRPLRGRGTNGVIKRKVIDALRHAFAPIRSLTSLAGPKTPGSRTPPLPDDALKTALGAIEKISTDYTELTLQDNLTSQERAQIHSAWGLLVSTAAGDTASRDDRATQERELIELAKKLG